MPWAAWGPGLWGPWAGLLTAPCPPTPPERHHFLGISIVGQSNDRGDGGIYIGSIMKGGAVAADGRIEPGDMLLQVGHRHRDRDQLGGQEVSTPTHRPEPLSPR